MVLSDYWTEILWDLWIMCGRNIALNCREFSQTSILPIFIENYVFPNILAFQEGNLLLLSRLSKPTSLVCYAFFFRLHLIFVHAYVHITGVIYTLFCFRHPVL